MPAVKSKKSFIDLEEVLKLTDIDEVKLLYADISKGYGDLSALNYKMKTELINLKKECIDLL